MRLHNPFKTLVLSGAAMVILAGCASGGLSHQPQEIQYAWSHSMSGDYLFAYDRSTCEQTAGSLAANEFFSCMENLGYFRIDPVSGAPLAAAGASLGEEIESAAAPEPTITTSAQR